MKPFNLKIIAQLLSLYSDEAISTEKYTPNQTKELTVNANWYKIYAEDRYKEIAAFFNTPVEFIKICCKSSAKEFCRIWDYFDPNNPENDNKEKDIIETYRRGSDHLIMRQIIPRFRILWLYEDLFNFLDTVTHCYKVLDFGCGVGDTGIFFSKLNNEITLSEISDSWHWTFLKWRYKKRNIPLNLIDIKADLPNNYFNVIIMIDVLEHCLHPLIELQRLYDSMEKDGHLFLSYSFGQTERAHLYQAAKQEFEINKFLKENFEQLDRLRCCGVWRKK